MRARRFAFAAAIAVATTLGAVGPVGAQNGSQAEKCLGLGCAQQGTENDVPESRTPATAVAGPNELERQSRAGFYEYGRGTSLPDKRAVAYVSPQGQHASMPASVRDLPVVEALAHSGQLQASTVVVFSPTAVLGVSIPTSAAGHRHRNHRHGHKHRPKARKSNHGSCIDRYFCMFDLHEFNHTLLDCYAGCAWIQLGPSDAAEGFKRLGNYGFNDRIDSVYNRRGNDSLLAKDWTGTTGAGTRYCSDSHSSDTTLGNNALGNNQASAVALPNDDIHC